MFDENGLFSCTLFTAVYWMFLYIPVHHILNVSPTTYMQVLCLPALSRQCQTIRSPCFSDNYIWICPIRYYLYSRLYVFVFVCSCHQAWWTGDWGYTVLLLAESLYLYKSTLFVFVFCICICLHCKLQLSPGGLKLHSPALHWVFPQKQLLLAERAGQQHHQLIDKKQIQIQMQIKINTNTNMIK